MASTSPGPGLTLINEKDITRGKILGGGAFGAVYIAKHVNWGKVAVKEFKEISLTSDIRKEADKMLRAISSPYLVRIMGLIEHSGSQIDIVMEYCEYGSLKEFEKKYMKCDCWARKVKMVQDIAFGMNYLHTLNPPIIHRDLKLDNVFVASGFDAKIGDLGLAVSSKTSIRRAGVAGTGSHIPTEASNPKASGPDEFWDIYTFSITSYELVFGKDPWPQQEKFANDVVVAVWVSQGHRPDVDEVPPEAPKELIDLIKKCWVAEPKQRPSFKVIVESVTKLFEANYERGLRRADRAISEQIDLVQETAEVTVSSTPSNESIDPWASIPDVSIKDNTVTAMPGKSDTSSASGKDSGVGTSDDVKRGLKGLVLHERTEEHPRGATTRDESDMSWQYNQTIEARDSVFACKMISLSHLAVCMRGCVKVYSVSTELKRSYLKYTVSIVEWEGKWICGVAVSESLPSSMLVICEGKPYVYQRPHRETTRVIKKYKIESDKRSPECIVANANTAVIKMVGQYSFIVCRLPNFSQQSCVKIDFIPPDLSITSDYLVIMGEKEMVVRSMSDVRQDVCRIKPPDGWRFRSVYCRNNAREIYAACVQGEYPNDEGSVYRYTWHGVGKPQYGNPTCVIEGLEFVRYKRLSVTLDGLLAVGQFQEVKIYRLQ